MAIVVVEKKYFRLNLDIVVPSAGARFQVRCDVDALARF